MKRFFGILISVFCFFVSLIMLFLSINYNKNNSLLSYDIENNTSYKVYLKENTYYDSPYLIDQNNIPINFIDYINVSFKNNIIYNKNIKTDYTYNVKAIIEVRDANTNGDNIVYSKEEILLDNTLVSDDNIEHIINKSVDVDYKKYNEYVNKYKMDLKMPVDAYLIVKMTVNYKNGLMDTDEMIGINIPLSVNTINITKNYEPSHHEDVVNEVNNRVIFIVIGIVLFGLSVITLLYSQNKVFNSKEDYKNYKLKRILSYYESIIVEVNEKFNNSNVETIRVNSFKDMVDLNVQLRIPIVYYKNDNIFVLKSDNTLYLYELNDNHEKI